MISLLNRGRTCLGISLGADTLWAVLRAGRGAEPPVRWWQRLATGRAFFDGDGYGHLQATIGELASILPRQYRKPTLSVQLALPDPVVNQVLFEFDEFPRRQAAARELVAWRYAKEFHSEPGANVCAFQVLGRKAGRVSVFCLAVEKKLLDCITQACGAADLVVHVVDAMACYQHDCLQDGYEAGDGALISLAADQWSLSLWDEQRRLRYFRGFWIDPEQDFRSLAARLLSRAVMAHARSNGSSELPKLYAIGQADEEQRLESLLDAQVRRPVCGPPGVAEGIPGLPEQALTVAMRRCA